MLSLRRIQAKAIVDADSSVQHKSNQCVSYRVGVKFVVHENLCLGISIKYFSNRICI